MTDCVFCTPPEIKVQIAFCGDLAWDVQMCLWNKEKVASQSVPHSHPYVILRKQGDEGITEYEPRKFLYRPGSREEMPGQE